MLLPLLQRRFSKGERGKGRSRATVLPLQGAATGSREQLLACVERRIAVSGTTGRSACRGLECLRLYRARPANADVGIMGEMFPSPAHVSPVRLFPRAGGARSRFVSTRRTAALNPRPRSRPGRQAEAGRLLTASRQFRARRGGVLSRPRVLACQINGHPQPTARQMGDFRRDRPDRLR